MCGIAGIVGKDAHEYIKHVRRMIDAMERRGPDGEGLYISPTNRCVLGHRRLAILDLSDFAAQPMLSSDGRWAFVYNGECYNYLALKKQFAEDLQDLHSSGDTEVMMRLLQKRGASILPQLNAMFALALWDEQTGSLLLARDRYGQKPLYIARVGELFLFASEVRALLASGLLARKVNPSALSSYLAYGAVQEPMSILQGVGMLPPQSFLQWKQGQLEQPTRYWAPTPQKQSLSPQNLRSSFVEAVKRHLISDVPLGLFLSGGIDSSALALAAAHAGPHSLRTLSVTFPDQPNFSEAKYAHEIAQKVGSQHEEIPLTGPMMLSMLRQSLEAMDQPTSDAINTYMVSMAAKQAGLKVALSGLGGDELFGGYRALHRTQLSRYIRALSSPFRSPMRKVLQHYQPMTVFSGKINQMLHGSSTFLSAFLLQRRVFSPRQIDLLAPSLHTEGLLEGLNQERFYDLQALIAHRPKEDAIALLELSTYMTQTLLRDSDVMGMHHSLEIRVPFLDTDFSDDVLMLEPKARQHQPYPKWRLVQALGDWFPKHLAERPKMGFALPFQSWMQKELKDQIQMGLSCLAKRYPVFQEKMLQRLWKEFLHTPEKVRWSRPWSLAVLGIYLEHHQLTP